MQNPEQKIQKFDVFAIPNYFVENIPYHSHYDYSKMVNRTSVMWVAEFNSQRRSQFLIINEMQG